MNTNYNYKNLGAAIVLEAVKEYFEPKTDDTKKKVILKELRSDYVYQFSGGMSLVVAEQLEKHPKEIAERLGKCQEELQ